MQAGEILIGYLKAKELQQSIQRFFFSPQLNCQILTEKALCS